MATRRPWAKFIDGRDGPTEKLRVDRAVGEIAGVLAIFGARCLWAIYGGVAAVTAILLGIFYFYFADLWKNG